MCTLAFLELVNEGNMQAQVVAVTIILFLFATSTIVLATIVTHTITNILPAKTIK